jgi:uncharacterized membrane protein YjjP (DUF1212 family)
MDKNKLNKDISFDEFLKLVKQPSPVEESDYSASPEVQADSKEEILQRINEQIPKHRTFLLCLVVGLTCASFLLLSSVVLFKMIWTVDHPTYVGISDEVINILSVGVFAELVGVVGVIVNHVWKNPK